VGRPDAPIVFAPFQGTNLELYAPFSPRPTQQP
jgi:hypothetical protein